MKKGGVTGDSDVHDRTRIHHHIELASRLAVDRYSARGVVFLRHRLWPSVRERRGVHVPEGSARRPEGGTRAVVVGGVSATLRCEGKENRRSSSKEHLY